MSALLHRDLRTPPPSVVGGEGMYLTGGDGRRYLDACGGVVVSSLGHNHPRVVAAIRRQTGQLSYAHAGTFGVPVAEELAEFLTARADGMSHAYFLSGGSEAVELTLKTAYQYHVERGEPGRRRFISRRQSYHGSTLAALSLTGNRQRRSIFEPVLTPSTQVSPCYAYRGQQPGESDRDYVTRLAVELESCIESVGPESVAGFVAETVVGSTSGAVPPVDGYFSAVRKVCDRYGILLVLDEVMCGMGRTGDLFAYQRDAITPDVLAVGKGLAAGYQPLSAMLVSPHVHATLRDGSGVLRTGQTFVNHPVACAAGLAVQTTIDSERLLDNVHARGDQLRTRLTEALADHPHVGDIRGRGLFLGLELVADRTSREPFSPEAAVATTVRRRALASGLLVYPASGTIDGVRGDHILLAPPFIATEDDIEQIVARLATVLGPGLMEG